MEPLICHLQGLNRDLLADVMSRADGLALALVASTFSDLRDIAKDESLWKHLCHSTWPSTALEEAEHLVSSLVTTGFDKLYADSYPLIVCDEAAGSNSSQQTNCPKLKFHGSPSDFVSFVDVYCKNKCVLSRILNGIPEAVDISKHKIMDSRWDMIANERQRWFLNCPFKLGLLDIQEDEDEDDDHDDDSDERPSPLSLVESRKSDHCQELLEDLRLSWVLLHKKYGKTVNLSSWKPLSVQKCWPFHGVHVMHFGCIIPVEESVLPHQLAKCIITTRFKTTDGEENMQWRAISMNIENITGSHVNGRSSLMILNQALYRLRSPNHIKVEKGFQRFEKQKTTMIRRQQLRKTLVDILYIFIEITALVIFCYILTLRN